MTDPVAAAKAALDKVIAEAQAEAEKAGVGIRVALGVGRVAAAPSPLVAPGDVEYVWMDESVSEAIDGGS